MPVGNRVCSVIAAFLIIIGLSACSAAQAQSAPNSVKAQSTLAGPTWGAVLIGPSDATNVPLVQQATELVATGVATAAPTATPNLPTLNRSLMGIQAYGYIAQKEWEQMMDRAQFMGFGWIKFQLSWKELESSKDQYTQQFDVIKKNIYNSGKRHFKILVSVAKAPDWARPQNARGHADGPPANPQDLSDFMLHLLQDKDITDGAPIKAVEIWNEPNTANEWTGTPLNAAAYAKLFKPVYQAIHAALPDLTILSAGMAATGDMLDGVNDPFWLKQLYPAGVPTVGPGFPIVAHPSGFIDARGAP